MPPCGMPAQAESVRWRAEIFPVTVQPRAGLHHLHHDVCDLHRGAKGVVGHRDRDPGTGECRRNERKSLLVERTPVSTMNVHQEPTALSLRAKDVHFFGFARAVRHVQIAVEAGPGPLRVPIPAVEYFLVALDYEPRIVKKVVICFVRVHRIVPEKASAALRAGKDAAELREGNEGGSRYVTRIRT